jgi:rhamnogalacturonan endolyase
VATIDSEDYEGQATGTLVVQKALATIVLGSLSATYDGSPHAATAITAPPGLAVLFTYDGSPTPPTNAGSYEVVAVVSDANYMGTAAGTLTIAKATAGIAFSGLLQVYDGSPKPVTVTTQPPGLTVQVTYDGSATPPTMPGSYSVLAIVVDANYEGSASATLVITTTALVRHAPVVNGRLNGSLQLLLGENTTLNSSAAVSGDFLVPGTPTVRLNGSPAYGGTTDSTGSASPASYTVTLNGGATLRHVVRRVDPLPFPSVAPPPSPTGTRDVVLNNAGQSAGNFATIRNLTLNSNAGLRAVPPGTYGTFVANGSSGFILGVAGSTTASAYNLQGLTLNSGASLQVVGPVTLTLANGVTLNSSAGNAANPQWLTVAIASGGLTLNSGATLHGLVTVPLGTVTLNGSLNGRVRADRLVVNGAGSLSNAP